MIRLNPYLEQNITQPIIENQMNWGNSLPKDLFGVIFSHLKHLDIQESACANKYWNAQTVNSVKECKISSLNTQISKMSELVEKQMVSVLSDSKIDQSKDLKAVISSTLEVRKKILSEVQNLNNPIELKNYLDGFVKEAMDHNRLDQVMDAINLIDSENLQRQAFNSVGDRLCKESPSVLIKLLLKLNATQKIQFTKNLKNYDYNISLESKIITCTEHIKTTTLTDLENLIGVLELAGYSFAKKQALEKIAQKMKDKGFFEAGYKLECDLFEKKVLPDVLKFLSSMGCFDLAKAVINEISFINKTEYQSHIKSNLFNDKGPISSYHLRYYSVEFAKIGYDELSLQFANMMTDIKLKEARLRDISIELLTKDWNKAAKIAVSVPAHLYEYQAIDALITLTTRLVMNGFQDKAYEIINAIPDDRIIMSESCKELLLKNLKANFK